MKVPSRSIATLLLAAAALPLSAQTINFPDFSSPSGMTMNGDAAQVGAALRVAPATLRSVGSSYFAAPLSVSAGFDTTFTFQINNSSISGGSGLAFVIHADPRADTALGDPAWAMGYAAFPANPAPAITQSLVLEMDCFQDSVGQMDPSHSHLSLHTAGTAGNSASETASLGSYNTPTDLSDGSIHTIRIVYNPGLIQVYYDGSVAPVISAAYDFNVGGNYALGGSVGGINLLGGTSAYVGFSAATPNSTSQQQDHDVLSWSWASAVAPMFPGNGADLALDVVVNGQAGTGSGGLFSIAPGATLYFNFSSPGGTLDGQIFGVAATPFSTGLVPAGIPGLGVRIDLANYFWLIDGFNPANTFFPVLAPGGFGYGPLSVPASLAGTNSSLIMQVATAQPGIGLSDAVVLEFQ